MEFVSNAVNVGVLVNFEDVDEVEDVGIEVVADNKEIYVVGSVVVIVLVIVVAVVSFTGLVGDLDEVNGVIIGVFSVWEVVNCVGRSVVKAVWSDVDVAL